MTKRLEGKVALVTGGSSGIGLSIAERFAREGATIAVVASRTIEKAAEAAATIGAAGGKAFPFAANVTDGDQVRALVDAVERQIGTPDILVNSAGIWFPSPFSDITDQMVDDMLDTNLKGVIRATVAVSRAMRVRGAGRIINIASISGIVSSPGYSLYSTSKAAVIAFTKAAALELAPAGIAVNAIAPGNTATPMNHPIRTAPEFAARRDWIARTTPSARQFTPAAEIAEAAVFLADGQVQGMHGTILSIDEGRSAGLTARLDA